MQPKHDSKKKRQKKRTKNRSKTVQKQRTLGLNWVLTVEGRSVLRVQSQPDLQNPHFSIEESSFSIEESLKNLRFLLKNLRFLWQKRNLWFIPREVVDLRHDFIRERWCPVCVREPAARSSQNQPQSRPNRRASERENGVAHIMQKESMKNLRFLLKNLRFLLKNLHLHCKNAHTKRSHKTLTQNAHMLQKESTRELLYAPIYINRKKYISFRIQSGASSTTLDTSYLSRPTMHLRLFGKEKA